MEFEFRRDVTGELHASFSMGCEALGSWLLEEVGDKTSLLDEVFGKIAALRAGECRECCLPGSAYNVRLTLDEVDVCDARIDFDEQELMTDAVGVDALGFYDEEARAFCGLDDFETMLMEWEKFISP